MIRFTHGNLIEARAEALVNTVNTQGVMGKGIALMFKDEFPENFAAYQVASKAVEIQIGKMFIQPGTKFDGPRWLINFPTKKHWRQPSKLEWIEAGLASLKEVIREKNIHSIALPPLGCGNGGLDWEQVRPLIEAALGDLAGVEVTVYQPTAKYQNVAKKTGAEKLTPARAMIAEMVRRYRVLGIDCTFIEIQKLAWFLERSINRMGLDNPLDLRFEANRYGPFAYRLNKLIEKLDGSYLHSDKRVTDSNPMDTVRFDDTKRERLVWYLKSAEARAYLPVLDATEALIDGFQSPLGMEALATVDWLIERENVAPTLEAIREGIRHWPAGRSHAERKEKLFGEGRLLELALARLNPFVTSTSQAQ